jgi:MoaA/NifB/PqqE/SkfB family radical SAM enzyme
LATIENRGTRIHANCTGGEPTISADLLNFLQWLISEDLAKNIILIFNTNGVSLKKPFLEAVQKFKKCNFSVSVDATGPVDHYIRFPINWQRRQQNIQHLMDLFPGGVKLFTSIHAMSISDYPNLLYEINKLNCNHSHVMVSYPASLDIRHMPLEFKQKMIERLEPCFDHSKGFSWNNGITASTNRLKMTRDDDQWQEAKRIIHTYDKIRPYTLASVQPELAPYII